MLNKTKIKDEFEKKLTEYDKDGGFRVFVEDYDNMDIDHELVFSHLSAQYEKLIEEVIGEVRESIIEENYILEEYLMHLDEKVTGFEIAQQTMKTRNNITRRIDSDIRTSLQERGIKIK